MISFNTKEVDIENKTVVTIGNFDGLHKGHQELTETAINMAKERDLSSLLLTFHPHPLEVFGQEVSLLSTEIEKQFFAKGLGFDYYVAYPFDDDFAGISEEAFVKDFLIEKLQATVVVVGEDFRFAKKREGTIDSLQEICKAAGVEVIVKEHLKNEIEHVDKKVSSEIIRQYISEGKIEQANAELGHRYFMIEEMKKDSYRFYIDIDEKRVRLPKTKSYDCLIYLWDPETGIDTDKGFQSIAAIEQDRLTGKEILYFEKGSYKYLKKKVLVSFVDTIDV